MVSGEPLFRDESGTDTTDVLIPDQPAFRAAQLELPFVSLTVDGRPRFWSQSTPDLPRNSAEQHIEGERWALALMDFYRQHGHDARARLLPDVLRHALSDDPAVGDSEYFAGFMRVLDAMLAFAARQCDFEQYVDDLGAEHHRTLAAWNGLAGNGVHAESRPNPPSAL